MGVLLLSVAVFSFAARQPFWGGSDSARCCYFNTQRTTTGIWGEREYHRTNTETKQLERERERQHPLDTAGTCAAAGPFKPGGSTQRRAHAHALGSTMPALRSLWHTRYRYRYRCNASYGANREPRRRTHLKAR